MPLSSAPNGTVSCIKKIAGNDDTKRFLSHLGFVEGASVTVISKTAGNLILKIKESRIAVEKSLAGTIFV